MKKKVAIFGNGWNNEYLELVIENARKRAEKDNVDIFAFINFSTGGGSELDSIGEKSIFTLPDIREFDGVMILANSINVVNEREYLNREVLKYQIPAITLEYELDGIPYLGTDTYSGVYSLVSHIVEKHHVRDCIFVSGPADNEESQLRMKATVDALQKFGIKLPPNRIIRGDWSYYNMYESVITWVKQHQYLPDAFICANDEMAIGVCSALDYLGIKVPDQVIVTGCDNVAKGRQFAPILTTVARGWDKLGYEGMDRLIRKMNGEEIPQKTVFDSVPVLGESCGCEVSDEAKEYRLRSIIGNYRIKREDEINEWHLRHIDDTFAKLNSVEDLKHTMGGNFEYNHSFEGSNFQICLVENYFEEDETNYLLTPGEFTEQMEIYVHLQDGKAMPNVTFPRKQLMVGYDDTSEEPHVYMFLPLHILEKCLGYVVVKDDLRRLYEQVLYTWSRHMSQDLERVKQNIRLEILNQKIREVSMTDALTGLRNRTGYDMLAFPYLQRCQKEGKTSAIVFADVNRMKLINDEYGHQQGDLALQIVAEAIKKSLPKNWVAVRYGGDEFIMVGDCKDQAMADEIQKKLADNLEAEKDKQQIVFPLTASFGAVIMHPGEDYSLEEYLHLADKAMYVTKQKYHASEKRG